MIFNENIAKIDYRSEIIRLKKEKNAVILAHYYQESEIQDLADFIGDSLELARKAKASNADIIVFCGVHFMAETAKIVNPERIVLLPDLEAGCSLADSCPEAAFRAFREQHPDHVAITYINCSTQVKALSDIICTSSNAEKIVASVPPGTPILFSPDKNLGSYIQKQIGREMLLWDGSCIVHETFSEQALLELKNENRSAKIIAHPECEEVILRHADFVGSTSKLLKYAQEDNADTFIVVTEPGIIHQMQKANPEKKFITAPNMEGCSCNNCPYMKLNTLEKIYKSLVSLEPRIEIEESLRLRALAPLERMLSLS